MKTALSLLLFLSSFAAVSQAADWIDVTSMYITNPNFDNNSAQGWTISADAGSTDRNYEAQEFWNGTWNIWQTIYPSNGHYRLSVSAYHRPGEFSESDAINYESIEITSKMYANDAMQPLKSIYSESLYDNYSWGCWGYTPDGSDEMLWYPNNMEAGEYCLSQGMYVNEMEFDVADGSLTFGIVNETYVSSNWTMLDNWKLEYYGEVTLVTGIILSETSLSLEIGERKQLTASVLPADAMARNVEWTSSDVKVATIDSNGVINALTAGTAIITATALDESGVQATCVVTVTEPEGQYWTDVTSVYITNPYFNDNSADGWSISAAAYSTARSYEAQEFWNGTWNIWQTIYPSNGHYRLSVSAFHRPGDFSESDAINYESIDITSKMYANDAMQPLLSIYSESLSEDCFGECWGYTPSDSEAMLWYPNTMQAGEYCLSQGMYVNELEFNVIDESVTLGIINETNVWANWTLLDNWKLEYYGNATLAEAITLSETSLLLVVGEGRRLTATVLPEDALVRNVGWTSSDENVATIDSDGNIMALSTGTVTIIATALDGSGVQAICEVMVASSALESSSLVITEIQSANIDQYLDPSWNYGGWVELYNPSESAVTLTGCWVSDDPSDLQKIHITEPMAILAKEYYNLWFDHFDKYYPTQLDMKLDVEGGVICISDPDGKLIASQEYPEAVSRCSYARKSLTSDEWAWTSTPTPEQANDGSTFCETRLEAPEVDLDSQIFGTTLTVSVNIPEGATLRYTTDGSAPTASNGDTSSTGLFYPTSTTTYRFCLVRDGYLPSPVVTRTYIYRDKEFALPILSVVSKNENFYSDEYGIFVMGVNGRAGNGQSVPCNWNMEWDRPANFEYFNTEGEMSINQETAIERCGGWSRAWEPYSFKVKANKQYELQNFLPYDFFEEKPYLKHKTLQIRNGGNDNYCRFKDPALQEIVLRSGIGIDCQAYKPVMHYINGRYAGTINMREPNNKHYVYANYGLDDDEIDQFEISPDSGYVQKCGTYESMQRWYDLAAKCGSDNSAYEEIKQMVDIDEFCNYMAVEFYLGSYDWPKNNIKGWKPIAEGGKFRFVIFDLDGTFSTTNSFNDFADKQIWTFDPLYGEDVSNITKEIEIVTIFLNMLNNDEFRKQFIDSYCLVIGSVFEPDRCREIVMELASNVESSQAIYNEVYNASSSPWDTANEIMNNLTSSRQTTMVNTLKDYSPMNLYQTAEQSVTLSANIDEARLLVNDLPVPTNKFDGKLFAPITFKAQAPAGYRFDGWLSLSEANEDDFVISKGSTWDYYDRGSLDSEDWTSTGYSYDGWSNGKAPLGYCSGDTMTTSLSKNLPTYYFANSFTLDTTPTEEEKFTLDYTVDDGFIIYVNGTEAGRYNMPSGTVTYDSFATTHAEGNPDSGTMALSASLFRKGTNYIAVEVHNNSLDSSDIYWDAAISHNSNETLSEYVCFDEEYDMPSGDMVLQACYSLMSDEEKEEEDIVTTPVVINEVSAGNSIYVNEYFKKDDWVELYNTTSEDIDLEGMYLTDNSNKPQKYQITADGTKASTIIPAHGFKIVWCSERDTDTELHANFKLGNNDGEMVRIAAADESWADSLVYCAHNGDQSVGRYPDGGENVYLMTVPTIKNNNMMTTYATLWEYTDTITDVETPVILPGSRSGGMSIACVGDYLSIKSEDSPNVTLGVYTTSGITIMYSQLKMEGSHCKVNISALPKGVYVARAKDDDGNECATKFVRK